MGHIHLGVLPRSRQWKQVVELLTAGAADATVIAQSAIAAEKDLARAVDDPVFVEAVRLLAMLPVAARSGSFAGQLVPGGQPQDDVGDLFELLVAAGDRLDRVAATRARPTDFAELARRALLGTLSDQLGERLPQLFDTSRDDLLIAGRDLASPHAFAGMARDFFRRLVTETLRYSLDRALPSHTGPDERFTDAEARSAFDRALTQYCYEATFIISEFSAGWYAKTLAREGAIGATNAAAYSAVALRKITEELKVKRMPR